MPIRVTVPLATSEDPEAQRAQPFERYNDYIKTQGRVSTPHRECIYIRRLGDTSPCSFPTGILR